MAVRREITTRGWRIPISEKRVRAISGMPPASGISVVKIVKSRGTHRTLSISLFPALNRRIELEAGRTASVPLDVNRPASRSSAGLLWRCYIYACVWITCVYPYYLPEVKNRGSFGAHATVIDATCSCALRSNEMQFGRLECDECTENATGTDTNRSISSRQRVEMSITSVLKVN